MDVDPGYLYIEKIQRDIQFFMMSSRDFISSNNFKLKTENRELVSFNGQSITFNLSNKEVSKWPIYLLLLNDEDNNYLTILS